MSYETTKLLGTTCIIMGVFIMFLSVGGWFYWKNRFRKHMVKKYGKECCTHLHVYRPNSYLVVKRSRLSFLHLVGIRQQRDSEEAKT